MSTVFAPWPENHWPEKTAGMQISVDKGVKISGSAGIDEKGVYKVKFSKQKADAMLSVLRIAGIELPGEDYDIADFAYENFENFLEEEGIRYLYTADKGIFDRALIETKDTEVIKLFRCSGASVLEGIEDLSIQSVSLLDNGNVGIDALYNIRRVFMRLQIHHSDFEFHSEVINSLKHLHDQEIEGDYVYYEYFTRPFFRVNFTYNIGSGKCEKIRFQALTLKI